MMHPRLLGIDGCRAGWIAINVDERSSYVDVLPDLTTLYHRVPSARTWLIDIPVGLPSPGIPRTLDAAVRRALPGRASSVFPVPVRRAVHAGSGERGSLVNFEETGKKLSKQSQAILPKIREADVFARRAHDVDMMESHPEFAFMHLNDGQVVMTRKASRDGLEERLAILTRHHAQAVRIYERVLRNTKRKYVARDDIVDALCLAVTLQISNGSPSFLTDGQTADAKGLPMRMGYADLKANTKR